MTPVYSLLDDKGLVMVTPCKATALRHGAVTRYGLETRYLTSAEDCARVPVTGS